MAQTYNKTNGDIASPVGKTVVDKLTRKTGNSLPVNHNEHTSLGKGSSNIKSPAQGSIVPPGSIKGEFKQD